MKRFINIGISMVGLAAMAAGQTQTAGFTYQGRLKDGTENVNGPRNAEFRLYDAGGTLLGTQAAPSLNFDDGLFTIALNAAGQFGTSAFNGQQRFLEIAIDGVTLSPRQPLATTPYAAFSLNTRGLSVATNGHVGIGTTSPQRALHLAGSPEAVMRLQASGVGGRTYDIASRSNDGALHITEGGDTRLSIFPNGYVKVGAGTPDRPLSISSDASDQWVSLQNSSGSTRWFVGMTGGGFNVGEAVAGNPTRLFIDAGGNIGIGTSDPTAKLHVAGTTKTGVLIITGGSDVAEPFNVNSEEEVITDSQSKFRNPKSKIEPGMVVSIDPERIGELRISAKSYDTTVAGIISGANGVNPGMMLSQAGTIADGKHPVALTGRVWCYVDADAGGAVKPGDLLTTSDTPGHAMRVGDATRASGAIIGKAMSSLDGGRGFVLVLVNLH